MTDRQSDKKPMGVATATGLNSARNSKPAAVSQTETPVISFGEPFVNVDTAAAHALVETLFAGTHRQIPRVLYSIVYKLAQGSSGGDIVDVFHYDNDQVSFAIADIAGKGSQAAVQAAMIKYGLRMLASNGFTPEHIMRGLNRLYLEHCAFEDNKDSFATVFFGVADATRRFLSYSNAGHEPVLLVYPDGTTAMLTATAPLIGVFADQHELFHQTTVELPPEALLVAMTDGVSEARNARGDQYGMPRIVESAVRHRKKSVSEIVRSLLLDVEAFTTTNDRDDVAIVVARFN